MRQAVLILFMAASAIAASAQTPANPTATSTTAAKPASTAQKSMTTAAGAKLPPGVPAPGVPAVRGLKKTAFSLQYQEIKIGTGAEAEPNKLYKVHYTGWLASDGKKFDSSYDHRSPVLDKDKKPVLDADGKPQLDDPQPLTFPQGYGRLIPGWDQGFYRMKIGGQRRLFIPWQLAYGAKGRPGPDAAHPVIPPNADLIFDVELLDVTEMPQPTTRPGAMGTGRPTLPGASAAPGAATLPAAPAATPAASAVPAAAPAVPAPAAAPGAPASPGTTSQPQSK
jgi:peptidylprolyl isomerase